MYTDQTLTCRDCAQSFQFTASEQDFYSQRGFSTPLRCPSCRASRKAARGDSGGGSSYGGGGSSYGPRQTFQVTCSKCGKPAEVPFQPRGDRPVYCNDCFAGHR